jgi:3'-5' exoribonuclease
VRFERYASPTIQECDAINMESGIATGQRYDDVGRVADACPSTRGHAPLGHAAAESDPTRHRGARPARAARRRAAGEDQGNGDPFVLLTLGNASGSISVAPIWSNQRAWADGADRGRVVQAIGQVGLYPKTGKRQIHLTGPLRVLPAEQVDLHAFLPRIAGDTNRLWDWIDKRRAEIATPPLRQVVDLFFADDNFRVRLEQTPGSVNGHHAKLGGLLLHLFEVTSIARNMAKTMNANSDLVVAGALLHDIGKVEAYEIEGGGFGQTPCGLLLGHVVLGCLMLERRIAAARRSICSTGQLLDLQHMILSHHGSLEFGSPVQPMTTEAEIVHWADEASAKANDMLESLDDSDAFPEGSELSKKVWRVGRRVWRRPHEWE